jgi:hypothetical protein
MNGWVLRRPRYGLDGLRQQLTPGGRWEPMAARYDTRVPPCTHARPRVCTISVRTGHVLDDDRASEATDLQSDIVLYVLLPCMHLASHMGSTCPLACVACISQCPASHDHLTPPPVYLTSARTKDLRTYHPTLPTTHARLMKMCTGVVSCTFNCFFVCAI